MSTAYYAGNWPAAAHFLFSGPSFGWHAEAGIHVLRLILSGALDRHPSLKLLSGHWGEFVAGWLDRLDEAIGWGTHLDRTVSEYYREHVWATPSGMYSQNQLQFILAEIGAERIIYSEDFPRQRLGRHRQVIWEWLWRSRCEWIGWRRVMADCVFQTVAAVMIWFQTAKRLVISVRHSGALIR